MWRARTIMTWFLLLASVVLILLLILYPWSGKTRPTSTDVMHPDNRNLGGNKVDCTVRKTLCDPDDPQACSSACNNVEEMKCVKLNDDYVCLPSAPDKSCNAAHGGLDVWTGYGFTDQKGWSCLCTEPQIFGGEHCDTPNPAYCGGGAMSVIPASDPRCTPENGYQFFNTFCVKCDCPAGFTKMMRAVDNTPICVSNTAAGGGGYMGMLGNYVQSPDWRNVYYNVSTANNNDWAGMIAKEFSYGEPSKVVAVLNKYGTPTTLTSSITTDLAALAPTVFASRTPFDPNYREDRVSYSYFNNLYTP
jgi:hypothetical protein